ncbi:MAG: branched-chain amino acid ABC transporter ATP-binding protein, partial [Chloroflexota bacterium]
VVVDRLAQTLCRVQDERGISLLIVEQDLYTAFAIADRAYVIENGRTVLAGATRELIADPRVREAYMGI